MTPRTVIFTSDHAWDSPIQISAHHLARQFRADGWRVLFLANPISPLHLLRAGKSKAIANKFRSWLRGPQVGRDDVTFYSPLTVLPFARFWPFNTQFALSNWHRFMVPSITRLLKRLGYADPDLMVIDTVTQAALAAAISPRQIIYRITDANKYFSFSSRILAQTERKLAQRADLVAYTGRNLESYAVELEPRQKLFTPHGVDLAHFTNVTAPRPPEYAALKGPIAVFVGSLEDWVDVKLVVEAARQLPEVSFILIGPRGNALERLESVPNLQWLGPRPYNDIPAYMLHATIGLIPFDRERRPELVNAINPIKLYEYFACGLPVVACRTKEMAPMEHLMRIYETPAEFIAQVRAAVQDSRNFPAQDYVQTLSWPNVYRKLLAALKL